MGAKPFVLIAAFWIIAVELGCGNNDINFPGMPLPTETPVGTAVATDTPTLRASATATPIGQSSFTPTPTPDCSAAGETCVFAEDCCSGECASSGDLGFICQ